MKLTLKHYGTIHTVENDHDDTDINELMEMVKNLIIGAGFPEKSVKEYFGEVDDS